MLDVPHFRWSDINTAAFARNLKDFYLHISSYIAVPASSEQWTATVERNKSSHRHKHADYVLLEALWARHRTIPSQPALSGAAHSQQGERVSLFQAHESWRLTAKSKAPSLRSRSLWLLKLALWKSALLPPRFYHDECSNLQKILSGWLRSMQDCHSSLLGEFTLYERALH